MATCPTCGGKSKGFFKQCEVCNMEHTHSGNLRTKDPIRPIQVPEDEDD